MASKKDSYPIRIMDMIGRMISTPFALPLKITKQVDKIKKENIIRLTLTKQSREIL